ncbi:MAG: succinate dehydrogenase, cytochrome b556 subunit [Proteobacteria bacterium]|jgi:succinate dehydrogenase / fumarate reductase, cytochrome b subunit|nr:succinate dehydrogenase, cytochrome b556 subunit [Pseudomonadota bacterium]
MSNINSDRPLSPHLQVYSWQLTMILSIIHRGSGIFLMMGTPVLVWWLYQIQAGAGSYQQAEEYLLHPLGRLLLLGWTFSIFYHLCNGIRHLFWDIGKGYEISTLYRSGAVVVVVSSLLTLATWLRAYGLI